MKIGFGEPMFPQRGQEVAAREASITGKKTGIL
jgi:hypothetical protein